MRRKQPRPVTQRTNQLRCSSIDAPAGAQSWQQWPRPSPRQSLLMPHSGRSPSSRCKGLRITAHHAGGFSSCSSMSPTPQNPKSTAPGPERSAPPPPRRQHMQRARSELQARCSAVSSFTRSPAPPPTLPSSWDHSLLYTHARSLAPPETVSFALSPLPLPLSARTLLPGPPPVLPPVVKDGATRTWLQPAASGCSHSRLRPAGCSCVCCRLAASRRLWRPRC